MNHSPRIVLRRLWDRNAYGLWFCVEKDGVNHYAKPIKFEIDTNDEKRSGYFLPDPTWEIPAQQAEQIFKTFIEEFEMQGNPAAMSQNVIKAKDENLKDLRGIIDRLIQVVNK